MFEDLTDHTIGLCAGPCDYAPPGAASSLLGEEVHIWRANLDDAPSQALSHAFTDFFEGQPAELAMSSTT